ncbi:MAG TPA: alpha/beta hydrolase [Candidatus Dormibacteraeota bacterium]|nr:alpha/beta hydrolase [Candidatus Dormibacteraeota bacterium]
MMPSATRHSATLRPRRDSNAAGPGRIGFLVGAGIGIAAIINYIVARRAERRNPPLGNFIDVDGIHLHYIARGGNGPTVILLHGNGTMARDFELSGLIDRLATDHRVIAFDRPGFGYSERPRNRIWTAEAQAGLLWRALQQMAIHRPIIVGHSWGALVALAMALRSPTQTAALALLSGYYYPSARRDVVLMFLPAVPIVGDVIRYTISPLLGRAMAPALFRKMFAPATVSGRFKHGFPLQLALRPWQIRAAAAEAGLMVPEASRLAGKYGALSIPVAIIAGLHDEVVDFDRQSHRLTQELPHSTLTPIPGTGHMVHYTAPEQVANAIRELALSSSG